MLSAEFTRAVDLGAVFSGVETSDVYLAERHMKDTVSVEKAFDVMLYDPAVMRRMKSSPIKEAMFFALHDFVKKGNDLAAVPWFAVTKFARRRKMERP